MGSASVGGGGREPADRHTYPGTALYSCYGLTKERARWRCTLGWAVCWVVMAALRPDEALNRHTNQATRILAYRMYRPTVYCKVERSVHKYVAFYTVSKAAEARVDSWGTRDLGRVRPALDPYGSSGLAEPWNDSLDQPCTFQFREVGLARGVGRDVGKLWFLVLAGCILT